MIRTYLHSRLRGLLLGRLPFVQSPTAYKRIILTSLLCLLTILIFLSFLILDILDGRYFGIGIQLLCILIATISLALNRLGRHRVSKLLLGITVNIAVYLFSESEPVEIGLYLFFIVTAIGSMALFGFEEMGLAIFGILLSLGFFLLSLYTNLQFLPKVQGDAAYITMNITTNFVLALTAASVMVYFIVSLNFSAEQTLEANQRQLNAKNEELVKVNTELDRFVYSTSHDLRSPISSILGLIELTKLSKDPEEIQSYLNLMESRLVGLNKFIKDISDYSRNARTEVSLQQVVISDMVHDILNNHLYYPGAERIDRQIDIDPSLVLVTDATRLQIILSNLISNAMKYMDIGKKSCFVKISAKKTTAHFELAVEDNGVGIPESYLPRIFDMFFRANENSEGSGLGLYIVQETITKLKGAIHVSSQPGIGSKFVVTLPFHKDYAEMD